MIQNSGNIFVRNVQKFFSSDSFFFFSFGIIPMYCVNSEKITQNLYIILGDFMNRTRQTEFLRNIVLASVFAALTTILTFYIKIPSHNGYVHLGDAVIYLAATLIPTPMAMVSSALGGMLADTLGGYNIYIIPTMIVKALLVVSFSSKQNKILTKRNIVALFVASIITTVGYYVAEVVLISISSAGSDGALFEYLLSPVPWSTALYTIPGSITQAIGSALVFIPTAIALDKINIKNKI